jgi:N-acetylglucosamine-6-phosphate deacetylase
LDIYKLPQRCQDLPVLLRAGSVLLDGALVVDAEVRVADGVIAAVGPAGSLGGGPVLEGAVLSPGFVDVHVHALDGCGFLGDPDLAGLSSALVKRGVTSFLATTVTSSPASLLASVSHIAAGGGPARCLGVHLEGPWLSPVRAGAQPAEHLRAPSVDELRALAAAGPVRLVTLAPELPGASALIAAAHDLGVVVSLGHSDCTLDQAVAALASGASHVTHCFNAMSGLHHREPGLVGAALTEPFTVEVIADGMHVHPAAVRALVAAAGRDRVCLVSDAVDADVLAGGPDVALGAEDARAAAPADVLAGGPDVALGAHDARGAVRLADGTLAGTRAGVDAGVRNVVSWGIPLADALVMATRTPAAAIGRPDLGHLTVGAPADAVLLDEALQPLVTLVGGEVVWQR